MTTQRPSLVARFRAATTHAQLSQPDVSRVLALMLRDHERVTPLHLARAAHMLKLRMPDAIETGSMLADWLMHDGWLSHSARPFCGQGMSTVNAYEVTAKWRKLAATGSEVMI